MEKKHKSTARYECKSCGTIIEIDINTPLSQIRPCCGKSKRVLLAAYGEGSQEKVENYEKKIHLVTRFSPIPYASRLMQETRFVYDNRKRLWRYNSKEGIYTDDGEHFINNILRVRLFSEEQQKKHYVNEIIDYIKGVCWTEEDLIHPPKNLIPFQNVMYDLDSDKFVDFSPEYFITNKIPHDIDSNYADYDMVDFFLDELVGEKKQTLYELMAYCMYRDYPYQKFFILFGDGNNGKSAFIKLLLNFLGKNNYSSRKPQEFANDKYASADLFGKLVNVAPDIPHKELTDSSIIRELTGEDSMTAQEKFKPSFDFYNYAKLIFSANECPRVTDRTKAFDRRIYIITFDKNITKPIPNIVEKITNENQMRGLAWNLIKVLKSLKKNGFRFSYDPSESEMSQLYDELSNSLWKFLKENTERDSDSKIPTFELKENFISWCEEKGLRVWKVQEIYRVMEEKFNKGRMKYNFHNNETGQLDESMIQAWEGLRWKDR